MCLFLRDMASKKILSIFLVMAFIILFPFLIVSLVLAYERSEDYCLSFGGVKDTGIHGVTLRHWLQVDGYTRLVFLTFAVFFFFASRYIRDHYALVTVQSNIFRIYYFFLLGWMIFGGVLFWGNVQRAIIFESIPTRETYENVFNHTLSNLENGPLDLSYYPRIQNMSQLEYVARRNSENYYDYHRFDKGPWFHQELVADWSRSEQNFGEEAYDTYMREYTIQPDYVPKTGWRYGCKPRVSAYMWILLLSHLVVLPIALLILGLRSSRTQAVDEHGQPIQPIDQPPATDVRLK